MGTGKARAAGDLFGFKLSQKVHKMRLHDIVFFVQHLPQAGLVGDVEAAFGAGEKGVDAPRLRHEEGQQRTAILSMKMAATLAYEKRLGQKPLLLLDDVMSELDVERQRAVMEIVIKKKIQTFITGTGLDFSFSGFGHDPVFHVEEGKIVP